MHLHRQSSHEIAIDVITSFRDLSPDERPAALARVARAADTSPTANSRRGRALIAFWQEASRAVALDTEHQDRTYTGTVEAHGNARDAAIKSAGDALFAFVVSIVPVTAAGLLAGQPVEA